MQVYMYVHRRACKVYLTSECFLSKATFKRKLLDVGNDSCASFYFRKSTLINGTSSIPKSFLSHIDWPVRNRWCYWPEFHGRYAVRGNWVWFSLIIINISIDIAKLNLHSQYSSTISNLKLPCFNFQVCHVALLQELAQVFWQKLLVQVTFAVNC